MKLGDLVFSDNLMDIHGLKVHVKGAELIAHTGARASFHKGRNEFYIEEAKRLQQVQHDVPDGQGGKGSYRVNPADQCEINARSHMHKFLFFNFIAKHLLEQRTYVLDTRELEQLEIGN